MRINSTIRQKIASGKPRQSIEYFINRYVGRTFGRLRVIGLWDELDESRLKYRCVCECGTEKYINIQSMVRGDTKSCGCLTSSATAARNKTHEMSHLDEYRVWQYAKARCAAKSGKNFKSYAARGITMCERWVNSFESFYEDMGPRPTNKHSLDRIDNLRGYSPDNCRWVTSGIQMANTTRNVHIEYEGETKILSEWSRITGVPKKTISKRYKRGLRGAQLFEKGGNHA